MIPVYAVTMNGRISTELKPRPGRSLNEELGHRLSLLDGGERFALLLWRLPDGVPFDKFDLESGPQEYIQCAGGLSGRFMCEMWHADPSGGSARHQILGRERIDADEEATEVVRCSNIDTPVRPNEVLNVDEVRQLFESYLTSGDIPSSYRKRDAAL